MGDNEEVETPRGSPPEPHGWRKVTRRAKSRDERSEGSEDVENLLDSSGLEDGSRYFKKWFDNTGDGIEPNPDDLEPDSARQSIRPETKKRKRLEKKPKKAHSKIKEPPAFPWGFGDQLSSVSRFGQDDIRETNTGVPLQAATGLDKRNVPSGVHFNRSKGGKKKKTTRRHSTRSESRDGHTTRGSGDPESEKSASSGSTESTTRPPVK